MEYDRWSMLGPSSASSHSLPLLCRIDFEVSRTHEEFKDKRHTYDIILAYVFFLSVSPIHLYFSSSSDPKSSYNQSLILRN